MKKIIYRISFRLTEKDVDLLWVDAGHRNRPPFSDLVKESIQGVIDGECPIISLPPRPNAPLRPKPITVKFYQGEDEELVAWLLQIEKGNRSMVIKALLRYCMEQFDFRPFLREQKDQIEKPAPRRRTVLQKTISAASAPAKEKKPEDISALRPIEPEPVAVPPAADVIDEEWSKFLDEFD